MIYKDTDWKNEYFLIEGSNKKGNGRKNENICSQNSKDHIQIVPCKETSATANLQAT